MIPGSRPDASVDSEPATGSNIGQPRDTGGQDPLRLSTGSGADSELGGDSSGYESGELSEEEDQRPMPVFPIGQPADGWSEAERKAPGYSRSLVYKQKAYYHRNKDTLKRKREEKMVREAGIPVSKKPKPIYGNIALLFGARTKTSDHTTLGPASPAPSHCKEV